MKKDLRGVVDAARRWGRASALVREAQGGLMGANARAEEARQAAAAAEAEFRELVDECADVEGSALEASVSGEAVGRAGSTWRSRNKEAVEADEVVMRAREKLAERVADEKIQREAFMGAVDAAPGALE